MEIKDIKYRVAFIVGLVGLVMVSCDEDESNGIQLNLDAVNIKIEPTSISLLDSNPTFTLTTVSDGNQNIESVTVFREGFTIDTANNRVRQINNLNELETVSITNSTGQFQISADELQLGGTDDVTYIHMQTNGATTPSTSIQQLTVLNPVSASVTASRIEAETTVNDTLKYEITTRSAIVDEVIVEQKIFKEGTFEIVPPPSGGWPVDMGQYIFQGEDFNVKDTVFLKVTARSGSLSASSSEISVVVDTQRINGISGETVLSEDFSQVNLETGSVTADPEIVFDAETRIIRPAEGVQIEFVEVTTTDPGMLFEEKDLIEATRIFEAGTRFTTFTPNAGQVLVYRITRQDKMDKDIVSTGLLKVNSVTTIDSEGNISADIAYDEEVTSK